MHLVANSILTFVVAFLKNYVPKHNWDIECLLLATFFFERNGRSSAFQLSKREIEFMYKHCSTPQCLLLVYLTKLCNVPVTLREQQQSTATNYMLTHYIFFKIAPLPHANSVRVLICEPFCTTYLLCTVLHCLQIALSAHSVAVGRTRLCCKTGEGAGNLCFVFVHAHFLPVLLQVNVIA